MRSAPTSPSSRAGPRQLPFADASFDALTFTYLLRYVDDVHATLTELARVLKPGAPFGYLEFSRAAARARCAGSGTSTPASGCRSPAG